uniref:UBC core domain-containing protein n=1 Tax=Ciona intestinalis TaxID=7719 RepID=H2Y213_CIOIN
MRKNLNEQDVSTVQEKWTDDSNLLQVLVSIQGLILNSEPYYNEAGYEGHRGTAEGKKNSRCYNEMVLLRLVQHMTMFVTTKHPTFTEFSLDYCRKHLPLLVRRVRSLLDWAKQSYKESDRVTEK